MLEIKDEISTEIIVTDTTLNIKEPINELLVEAPLIILRKPLDPNPYLTSLDKPKTKSNYKEEKNLKKFNKLNKTLLYKDSYKEKEYISKTNNSNNDISLLMEKIDLAEDIILIIKDKIKTDQITLTGFELKTLHKIFEKYEKKSIVRENTRSIENSLCFTGDKCIVWNCRFEHSATRKKECKCNDNACDKLHTHQALCKNQNHASDCAMAHRIQDLK